MSIDYLNLAVAYDHAGNYQKAIATGKKAAELAKKGSSADARHQLFTILSNLSHAYQRLDSLHKADDMLQQAWEVTKTIETDQIYLMMSQYHRQRGVIHRKLKRFTKAKESFLKLESIVKKHFSKDGDSWTDLYYEQFLLYLNMLQADEAKLVLDQFSEIMRSKIESGAGEIGNHKDLIILHSSFSKYYTLQDKLQGGNVYLDSARQHLFHAFDEIKFVREANFNPLIAYKMSLNTILSLGI